MKCWKNKKEGELGSEPIRHDSILQKEYYLVNLERTKWVWSYLMACNAIGKRISKANVQYGWSYLTL